MSSLCRYCGGELGKFVDERKQENTNPSEITGEYSSGSCQRCREKQERESRRYEGLTPALTPSITPTTSLSSSDRSFSSDFSVDGNPFDRGILEECRSQEDKISWKRSKLKESSIELPETTMDITNSVREINNTADQGDIIRDIEVKQFKGHQEAKEGNVKDPDKFPLQEHEASSAEDDQMNTEIWEPPEPENPEDELEVSVANNDEDDEECGDGFDWRNSNSLINDRDEHYRSHKLKEEKQRRMQEAINRKFKEIVGQLITSVGVTSSAVDGENWVDKVTALSWEAASLLKPAVINGNRVDDPNAYIKVKCIATGSRCQSEVIKGLVFKKHAAHKHMPTKYKNPRILLVEGDLGQSSSGLASFKSMAQDKDYVKPVVDRIETCDPNVILVEKSVSRDVQESILSKGMTLVTDMKLHRLKRIARCIGSPILSIDTLSGQKLKHCDSFHIEKFVEELNSVGEGGKKLGKTLMFLEGCSTRLGCTILLKGSHSDELKRIKEVVQYAVVMAYHLKLETAFLFDLQTMFSTIPFVRTADVVPAENKSPDLENGKLSASCLDESIESIADSENVINIPISNGFEKQRSNVDGRPEGVETENGVLDQVSVFSHEPYNPFVLTSLASMSGSIMKVSKILGNHLPTQSLSAYLGLGQFSKVVPVSGVPEVSYDPDAEIEANSDQDIVIDDAPLKHLVDDTEALIGVSKDDDTGETLLQSERDNKIVMDSQSILVLTSKRNARKGTICEQSHFSHIMFYKHFDVPLGMFLRENLFNKESQCNTCNELPQAHCYYYTHHDKQLTIQIKQLPEGKRLPGGANGKLWMWSRCGRCKTGKGIKSSKRVLISTATWSLSFGKFLELSFSRYCLAGKLSSCGHSLDSDFLHFFGQGSMVAIFRYSLVATYIVSLPPQKLETGNSIKTGWLEREFENIFTKGISLFEEVASFLKRIRLQFSSSGANTQVSVEDWSDIEEMLKSERLKFEASIKQAFEKTKNGDDVFHKLLSLNRMRWELLLEGCIWDRRLHALLSPAQQAPKARLHNAIDARANFGSGDMASIANDSSSEIAVKDIPINGHVQDDQEEDSRYAISGGPDDIERHAQDVADSAAFLISLNHSSGIESHRGDDIYSPDGQGVDESISNSSELETKRTVMIEGSRRLGMARSNDWFWLPFSEIQSAQTEEIERAYLSKFESANRLTQENLPTAHQIISEEGSRLHISLGDDRCLVSDYEDEMSSLIACALARLEDHPSSGEASDEDTRKENVMPVPITKHSSFDGYFDPGSVPSNPIVPREESRFHSFDGFSLLESLNPPECRREISFGPVKPPGKSKYTVTCLYADKFQGLRKLWGLSEFDYIASLSRCKQWDAKGGKSKSVFAKTIDDRFIIKEIKKTEYDSFLKFAPEYFKYIQDSFDNRNQTCLAKLLGIYQVVIRQTKSGKEIRHDLMVMENLTFNRKVTRQYDLKGALHARFTQTADGAEDVLLDQNFVNDMGTTPLYVSNTSKRILQRAVWNDTAFLNRINVMDYSLLVGVDAEKQELVCGIIDYLRQYTWDKQLETWVKSSLVVPKNVLPTVISPDNYKRRFRKFMSTNFFSVPDHWCQQGSSDPCELCSSVNYNTMLKPQSQRSVNDLSTKVHS